MKFIVNALVATLFLVFTGATSAQPYALVGFGSAKADVRTTPQVRSRDWVPASLGVGWRFNRFLAVEAGYIDVPSQVAITPSMNAFWSADGYTLAAVGNVPLGASWSLVGKIGVWDAESEFKTFTVPDDAVTSTKTDLGSRPLIGAGVEFHLSEHIRLRAIYEQVRGKDSLALDKLRMLSVGMIVHF